MKKNLSLYCFFAFVICVENTHAQTLNPIYPYRLGMETYTYQKEMDSNLPAALNKIKALGITLLESDAALGNYTPASYKKLLDAKGMQCISAGADYDDLVKNPNKIISDAKTVGASFLMTAWIPHETGDKKFTLDIAKQAVNDFNRIGKMAKDSGIIFCYHTHGFEFVPYENETLFDYIVQNTNPKYVSFEMDIMWTFHGGQNPADLLLKYPNRWRLMHLKDIKKGVPNDLTGGTAHENDVALGTGQLDVFSILKAAKKVGVQYYFIEDESPDYAIQVPQTISYLKSIKE